MTMRIEGFKKEHLQMLSVQDEQTEELASFAPIERELFTAFWEGEILGVFGSPKLWAGHYLLISLIDKRAGAHFPALIRRLKKMIDMGIKQTGAGRVSTTVRSDFNEGARLAKLLGFTFEGTMRNYLNHHDYDLYARTK